ncbi:thioesterase [Noviherbaspirillum cavernae]|uniref:Thioesterase n=1 Tax=Noviherbaspirillum cavernae TaxID=2320862 RepID=A0A418X228_9BURK|nr:alpha/beta fold hydrolase [Noviherbaspirillum cavernae]RJG06517.1 thioesterase [Noviherbaspirillum cavernae]
MFRDTRLLRLHASPQPDLLVCFPHAGTGASAFRPWTAKLKLSASVALVQLPGREDRMHEAFSQTLAEVSVQIADELAAVRAGTLFLFGHSMGASIAWAVAAQLWRRHGLRPIVILSAQSPDVPLRDLGRRPGDLREWFALLGEDFPKALENPELLEIFQRTLSADCAWMERELAEPPAGRLPIDLHCVYATQDGLATREAVARWRDHTSASFSITPMRGGHMYFLKESEELLAFVHHLIEVCKHDADSTCIG